MKKRNPIAVALLPLVTFGIYSIYWLIETGKELQSKQIEIKPFTWLYAPFGAVLFGLALAVTGGVSHTNAITFLGSVIMTLALVAITPLYLYWVYIYAKGVETVTGGKMSTAMTMILFYLLGSIGQAIVQDAFNNVGADQMPAGPLPTDPAAPAGPSVTPPAPPVTPAPPAPTNPVGQ